MTSVTYPVMHRRRATAAGSLFLVAIAVLFIGESLYRPVLDSADVLATAHPRRAVVIVGILIEFMGVLAVILIPAVLYPVLRAHDEVLSLSYAAIRVLEGAILSIAYVAQLSLVGLSATYLERGEPAEGFLSSIVALVRSIEDWAGTTGLLYLVVFTVGSAILFTMLDRAYLVPRWITRWGILASGLLLIGAVLAHLDAFAALQGAAAQIVFAAPIALAEILLAGQLILNGFKTDPAATGSSST